MEYIEGSTLRDVVASHELNPEHALAIVPHLCDALQYAHDKGGDSSRHQTRKYPDVR